MQFSQKRVGVRDDAFVSEIPYKNSACITQLAISIIIKETEQTANLNLNLEQMSAATFNYTNQMLTMLRSTLFPNLNIEHMFPVLSVARRVVSIGIFI